MALFHEIDTVSNNCNSNAQQNTFLKDVLTPSHVANEIDLKRILELLNTTNDINLQTRLFSALSASLMLNNSTNFEVIISYNAVYEKVNSVLTKGLPRKAEHALNFLSALLYVDADDVGPTKRRTLALHAKNMIRVSGCLATMSDMFTNCMMFHDTWRALCQCLAAACGGSDLNQSYCTHLIPVCIQMCNQTNIEIFSVLQSLMENHKRNMELFLNRNGLSIFSRELLHYDKCLQVLIAVVQNSPAVSLLVRQVTVLDNLREFLRLYGPSSQPLEVYCSPEDLQSKIRLEAACNQRNPAVSVHLIGQKAKIILNHVALSSRGSDPQTNLSRKEPTEPNIVIETDSNRNVNNTQLNEHSKNNELDDTATLMQKVMIEVFKYKQSQPASFKPPPCRADANSFIRNRPTSIMNSDGQRNNRESIPNETRKIMNPQRRNEILCNNYSERSFSCLNYTTNRSKHHVNNEDKLITFENQNAKDKKVIQRQTFSKAQNNSLYSYSTMFNEKPVSVDGFEPKFSSTPKHGELSKLIDYSKSSERKSNLQSQSQTLQSTRKVAKRRHNKNDKKLGNNKSLSSRFVSAINESCTTLVRTVANIFSKNIETSDISKDKTLRAEDASCSYSFLNYMQKRDAILHKVKIKNKDYTDFSAATELCDTCDTQTLKRKLAKSENMKQTVKKLKLGINLYGCDFKKISKTMWPRDSYMTPTVLYNLYRKLLLK